jgi:hypothetical protein|tara:strand:+ start:808 stop:1002 length:195 start_codon:yes stop_codon:yes gene_type:complete
MTEYSTNFIDFLNDYYCVTQYFSLCVVMTEYSTILMMFYTIMMMVVAAVTIARLPHVAATGPAG